MAEIEAYIRVSSVEEIFTELKQSKLPVRFLAGGTDLLLKVKNRISDPAINILDISGIKQLSGIHDEGNAIWIGAATKLMDIERSLIIKHGALQVLADGASRVGSPQIRNLATIGGNLCNAAPSADTAAPALVLDASAQITSANGTRILTLSEFFLAPGKTALNQGEILSAIIIPKPPDTARSTYIKLSPRRAMDLAVVGVAVYCSSLTAPRTVRLALGAVAPTPLRIDEAETLLSAAPNLDAEVVREAALLAAKSSRPIDDVRSSAQYRQKMVENLTLRAIQNALEIS